MKNTVVIGQLHFKKNDMIGAVVKTRNIYYGLVSTIETQKQKILNT